LLKLFCMAIFASLVCCTVLSQDATKVEPKHYRLAFENDKVQVVYIHYGPHEKSREHSHPQGVVVNVTEAHLLFTDQDGKTQEVYAKPGEARWFPPFRHTVENLGETPYSGVYIGVRNGPFSASSAKQPAPQLDEQTARILAAYLLSAPSAQETEVRAPRR
jgi:quercetin dioxygenase-like cupin family protein